MKRRDRRTPHDDPSLLSIGILRLDAPEIVEDQRFPLMDPDIEHDVSRRPEEGPPRRPFTDDHGLLFRGRKVAEGGEFSGSRLLAGIAGKP